MTATAPDAAGLDDPSSATRTWFRLLRVTRRLEETSDRAVRASGLSGARFELLAAVSLSEGASQRELAATLGVTKGNVAQIAARLETEGLVRREPDGRLSRVYLTSRARAMLALAVPVHAAALADRLSVLSTTARAQFDARLAALDAALRPPVPDDDAS